MVGMTDERLRALVTTIVRRVAELPDRTSPDDWPEAMLVTSEELTAICIAALEAEGRTEETPWQPMAGVEASAPSKRWTEVLCQQCGGNGVIKIPGGVSQCPRCDGRCYDPAEASAPSAGTWTTQHQQDEAVLTRLEDLVARYRRGGRMSVADAMDLRRALAVPIDGEASARPAAQEK